MTPYTRVLLCAALLGLPFTPVAQATAPYLGSQSFPIAVGGGTINTPSVGTAGSINSFTADGAKASAATSTNAGTQVNGVQNLTPAAGAAANANINNNLDHPATTTRVGASTTLGSCTQADLERECPRWQKTGVHRTR